MKDLTHENEWGRVMGPVAGVLKLLAAVLLAASPEAWVLYVMVFLCCSRTSRTYFCMLAVLLIRTYAFFGRNHYLLAMLLCALGGVVGYQLFVDTSEMMREFLR